ncbi:MAG: DNA-binding domain-containing protein [Pseudolabrys sp.]
MPSLLELQRGFRTAVLAGTTMPPSLIREGQVSAAARLAIYRNNVIGNLTRALRLSYPAVERLVGEDFFAGLAQRFIEAAPPSVADLNQYGEGVADFLASFEAAASVPYLANVARLEWAVSRALHAPPALRLTPEGLSTVPPEREAELRFEAHPTLSLLALAFPAHAIWDAVLADDADDRNARLAAIDIRGGGETLAVLRSDGALDVEFLTLSAFELAQALAAGCPLGEALAGVPADDAAPLLADFLARGFFAGFSFSAEDKTSLRGTPS